MKKLFIPRLTSMSLALLLTAAVIVVSDTGCKPKPACGNKRDHRKRKKRVKKFAPGMSNWNSKPTGKAKYLFV